MEIEERVPDLSDKQLESLRANAIRLASSGNPRQQEQAGRLLPLLDTEMEQRRATRVTVQAEKRKAVARRPVSRKVKAKATEE